MTDHFKSYAPGMSDPIQTASAISPNDSADLAKATRALYVGGSGNLRVTLVSGDIVSFSGVNVGWHPLRVQRVWATGTTASSIVGCL